eukprot:scaffold356580_cov18-Prasinocladus_malaysianus.AAC.1
MIYPPPARGCWHGVQPCLIMQDARVQKMISVASHHDIGCLVLMSFLYFNVSCDAVKGLVLSVKKVRACNAVLCLKDVIDRLDDMQMQSFYNYYM